MVRREREIDSRLAQHTFLVDHNLGNHVLEQLRQAGFQCERLQDHLEPRATDGEWMLLCQQRGWCGITVDQQIRKRPDEVRAFFAYEARIFCLVTKNASKEENAQAIVNAKRAIVKHIEENGAPFFVLIHKDGSLKSLTVNPPTDDA